MKLINDARIFDVLQESELSARFFVANFKITAPRVTRKELAEVLREILAIENVNLSCNSNDIHLP